MKPAGSTPPLISFQFSHILKSPELLKRAAHEFGVTERSKVGTLQLLLQPGDHFYFALLLD